MVLCSLEHMKKPRSIYRHGRVYPVTVITDSSLAVHVCVCGGVHTLSLHDIVLLEIVLHELL